MQIKKMSSRASEFDSSGPSEGGMVDVGGIWERVSPGRPGTVGRVVEINETGELSLASRHE